MDIADQLKEIGLFFTKNGLVAILEKVARPSMAPIEVDGVPGKEFSHYCRYAHVPRPNKKMYMVAHEGKGIDGAGSVLYDVAESIQKLLPVEVINEEITLIDPPQHYVMEGSPCIQAGVTWHKVTLL